MIRIIASGALLTAAALAVAGPAPAAPVQSGESTSLRLVSKSLQVGEKRRVAVKVRCSTRATCTGTMRLRVGNSSDRHPKRYRVAGRKTVTIQVGITPTARRKIEGDDTLATVSFTEGERKSEREVPIRDPDA